MLNIKNSFSCCFKLRNFFHIIINAPFLCNACEMSSVRDVKVDIDGEKTPQENNNNNMLKSKRSLQKWKSFPNSNNSNRGSYRSRKWSKNMYSDILEIDGNTLPTPPEKEEAVGIITMEDVIEELLQVLSSLNPL